MRGSCGVGVKVAVLVLGVALSATRAWADVTPAGSAPMAEASEEPALTPAPPSEPEYNWQPGPASIDLGHEISLALPERHAYLGIAEARKLLEKQGSFHNDDLLGLVVGKAKDATWFVTIRYDESGFVKDTDTIDADDLLKQIREGTNEANEERKQKRFPALTVDGWAEPPRYQPDVHHLVWALTVSDPDGASVNFNTRVLGRKGIVSLNLVCDPQQLADDKPEVASLLAGTSFKPGSRYEDFDSKVDKVSEYGLAGLILGGVGLGAAKLGLFAKLGAILIAAKKGIALVVAGAAAYFRRLFGRKKPAAGAPSTPETP